MSKLKYKDYCNLLAEIYCDFFQYIKEDLRHGESFKDLDGVDFAKQVEKYISYDIKIKTKEFYDKNFDYDSAMLLSTCVIYDGRKADIIISSDVLNGLNLLSLPSMNFAIIKESCSIMLAALCKEKKLKSLNEENYPHSNVPQAVADDLQNIFINKFGVSNFDNDGISDEQKMDELGGVLATLLMYEPEDVWSERALLEIKKLNGDKDATNDFNVSKWIKDSGYRSDIRSARLLRIFLVVPKSIIPDFFKELHEYSNSFSQKLFKAIKLRIKARVNIKFESEIELNPEIETPLLNFMKENDGSNSEHKDNEENENKNNGDM